MITDITFDVETTGSVFSKHALVELGAVAHDAQEREIDRFHVRILPAYRLSYSVGFLQAMLSYHPWNGFRSEDQWRSLGAIPEREALQAFHAWVGQWSREEERPRLWAHNASFDRGFLACAYARHGVDDEVTHLGISHHYRCTMLRFDEWRERTHQPGSVSLAALARLCGHWTDADEAQHHHDALEDALAAAAGRAWLRHPAQRYALPTPV